MTAHRKATFQPMLTRLSTLLAAAAVATFISFWIMIAAVRFADIEPSDNLFWAWVFVGWLGLAAALVFGTLALLAFLCVVVALFRSGQTHVYLPAIALLLLVAVFAAYTLLRS